MKNNASPFKRNTALMTALSALVASGIKGMDLQIRANELAQSREFQSRGKGGGHRARGSRMKAFATMRAQRSKYEPHQGKREIARRLSA